MPNSTPSPAHRADLPPPAGATEVFDWDHPDVPINVSSGIPGSSRYFYGSSRTVDPISHLDTTHVVEIDGMQRADGRVEREIVLDGGSLTPG